MPRSSSVTPIKATVTGEIWVVAADAGRARIFSCANANGKLAELEDLLNPDLRLQEHESTADRKGRVTQGAAGIGHAFEPRHTQAENSAAQFAKTLAHKLDEACQQGKVGRIYLIAEPSFLGLLRKVLTPATRLIVQEEIASDLTRLPVAQIREVLPAHL